jgi:entericidin A
MNDIKRKLFLAVLLAVSVVSLSACNTVSGAGKDVQKAGEAIEDTAEDAKN